MRQDEKNKILALIEEGRNSDRLTFNFNKRSYLDHLNIKDEDIRRHIEDLLLTAYQEKNAEDLELSLLLAFIFDFVDMYHDLLCKLIVESWHYKHEDIARVLQRLCSPDSIDAICETINMAGKLEYLAYDDGEALIRKCCWALGDIDTPYSIEKLRYYAASDDPHINKYALHQLKNRNLI